MRADPEPPAPGGLPLSRRRFLELAGLVAGLSAGAGVHWLSRPEVPRLGFRDASLRLWDSLTPFQRQAIARGWDHPARQLVNHVACVDVPRVAQVLTPGQRALVQRIYETSTSEAHRRRFGRLVGLEGGGLDPCECVLYGDPRSERFQVALYGGHLLVRAGGASAEGSAFGGPIGYGHQLGNGVPRIPGNAFASHLEALNRVTGALPDAELRRALVAGEPPNERLVQLQGHDGVFDGLPVAAMAGAARDRLGALLDELLSCYEERSRRDALACIERNGGVEALHLAVYESRGRYDDGAAFAELPAAERAGRGAPWWHDWRLEGPGTVVHFRGWPHPHASIHVADHAGAQQNVGEVLLHSDRRVEGEALRAWLQDAQRAAAGVPLGFVGELSARVLPGPVTTGLAWTFDPFGEELVVATIAAPDASQALSAQAAAQGRAAGDASPLRVAASLWDVEVAGALGAPRRVERTGLSLRDVYVAHLRAHGLARVG